MKRVLLKVADRAPKKKSDAVVKKFTEKTEDGRLRFKKNPPQARVQLFLLVDIAVNHRRCRALVVAMAKMKAHMLQ